MKSKTGILHFINVRFPLQVLVFTTLSTVLASADLATESFTIGQVLVAFIITILFLFHIRAIDERRDFTNDSKLHPDRPVQQGVISIKTLLTLSITGIVISLILAFFTSIPTFIIACFFIVFTSFAAFDFFIPSVFKNKPVLYHIVNSPQMVLLQWLIFSIFTKSFSLSTEMYLFMLLIYNNIFILELVRKINAPEKDSGDSFTAHLGLKKSLIFLISLVLSGFIIYVFILSGVDAHQSFYFYGVVVSLIAIGVFGYFNFYPRKSFQKIMELSAVLLYVFINMFIYIAI